MSINLMRRQSSAFRTVAVNRSLSRKRPVRILMTCSTLVVEAAVLRTLRKSAKELCSSSTWLAYRVRLAGREPHASVK